MLNKQTIINLFAQLLSGVITFGIGFFLTPFIVNRIGVEAYGFVGLANNFISYIQIISVALNSMAGRFITISLYQENYENTKKYFTSVFYANIFLSLCLTFPLVIFVIYLENILEIPTEIVLDVKVLFGIFFANFLLNLLGSVFGVSTFATNRLDLASINKIFTESLRVLIVILLFSFFIPKVSYMAVSSFLSTILLIIINIYFTRKLLPTIQIKKKYFDINKIKEILSSGIWNSITQLSQILSKGLNLLMSNIFIGATSMGVLSVASTIPQVILALFGIISKVFAPQLTISFAKEDRKGMFIQLVTSIKILGFFSSIPLAIIFVYGDIFYSLWVPEQNAQLLHFLSIIICLGFVLALPLEGLWNIFATVNKVKQSSIFLLSNSLLNIIIVLILLPIFEDPIIKLFIIVGIEALVSIIRALTFLPLFGAKCLNIKLTSFYPAIIKNILSIIIVTFLSIIIKKYLVIEDWFMLILASFFTLIIACIINLTIVLDRRDRSNILMMIKLKTNR